MTTITNFLRINAQRYPGREALVFGDVRIAYQEYDNRVDRIVSSLLSSGLQEGDRVAVLATNPQRYVELQCVLARAGLVLVPVNAILSATDILYLVNDARPRAFFFDPGYKETWHLLRKSTDCIDISVGRREVARRHKRERSRTDRVREGTPGRLQDSEVGRPCRRPSAQPVRKVLKRVLREKYWQGGRRAAITCADTAGATASLGDHLFNRGTQT